MKNDDAKRLILERRRRFIAAALTSAGIGVAGQSCGDGSPQVCLAPQPQTCLSIAYIPPDAHGDGDATAGGDDGSSDDAPTAIGEADGGDAPSSTDGDAGKSE